MLKQIFLGLLCLLFIFKQSFAQQKLDSVKKQVDTIVSKKNLLKLDTSAKKFNPKVATLRSALIPGWGQAYNKKYWKIPIVYGALGTAAGVFFYNLTSYKRFKEAVILKSDSDPLNDTLIYAPYRNLPIQYLRIYRNSFRQNLDYSVLTFIILWGLNIVDATVDAHLKSFDVSPDISLRIKPALYPNTGISFVFNFKP